MILRNASDMTKDLSPDVTHCANTSHRHPRQDAILGATMPAVRQSAGILLFRHRHDRLEVFLAHPGGPFWSRKDAASWTIPKGEFEKGEEPLAAAIREFQEETSFPA